MFGGVCPLWGLRLVEPGGLPLSISLFKLDLLSTCLFVCGQALKTSFALLSGY